MQQSLCDNARSYLKSVWQPISPWDQNVCVTCFNNEGYLLIKNKSVWLEQNVDMKAIEYTYYTLLNLPFAWGTRCCFTFNNISILHHSTLYFIRRPIFCLNLLFFQIQNGGSGSGGDSRVQPERRGTRAFQDGRVLANASQQ